MRGNTPFAATPGYNVVLSDHARGAGPKRSVCRLQSSHATEPVMLIAVHQPHYIPWLGYLDRMARADLFIVLDHVQFERRNYQNRTQILLEGEPRWLTVPVVQLSQKERIVDKRVDNSEGGSRLWGPNHFKTLRYAYRKAPYFDHYAPRLQEILEARWERLVDLNLAALQFLRDA